MAYFDGLIETILAVGLVKPKQGICPLNCLSSFSDPIIYCFIYAYLCFPTGILQPHIHYLLVLATSVDVVILGLSFPKGQAGEFCSGLMRIQQGFIFKMC